MNSWVSHITGILFLQDFKTTANAQLPFSSEAWETWFPNLIAHYRKNQELITSAALEGEGFKGPFPLLPQASCTCNLGPHTVTPMHRDTENLSYGVCMVSAFGDFDPEEGGELFLYEPRVVFPMGEGDLLIFPSASITHGNLPLSPKENQSRYSFTCYSAAGLFQWVANGQKLVRMVDEPAVADWEGGWDLFSTMPDLRRAAQQPPG